MNILKYKYKAHRLINSLFYIIIFIIGFILGFGAKNLNFNKIISQFLMIENVQAYTLDYGDYNIDEKFIYNIFLDAFPEFDISTYNKIICTTGPIVGEGDILNCSSTNKGFYLNKYDISVGQSAILYALDDSNVYSFQYKLNDDSFHSSTYHENYHKDVNNFSFGFVYLNNMDTSSYHTYSNFNFEGLSDTLNTRANVLDFSEYTINLNFYQNLFSDDSNFKKVCVNSNSSFSITKKHTDGITSGSDHDYIWFPYGIYGIKQFNYSTEMSDGYYDFEDPYKNYYFSSYEKINSIWNTEYVAGNFESKGYTDKYKYYGYTAYLFLHWYNFNDGQTYNFFPIFQITDNVTVSHISSSGTNHGGGGLRLDGDEEIEISNQYCFYIKNEYEVNEVILDEWGDFHTTVNTPNGPIDYGTSINKNNSNTDKFLSQPINFINSMKDTINFINSLIYEFYISLPALLRTFIITVLIILLIMLIMRIGGYK